MTASFGGQPQVLDAFVAIGISRNFGPAAEHALLDEKFGMQDVQPVEFGEQVRSSIGNRPQRIAGMTSGDSRAR
jgi:hypothetical protein